MVKTARIFASISFFVVQISGAALSLADVRDPQANQTPVISPVKDVNQPNDTTGRVSAIPSGAPDQPGSPLSAPDMDLEKPNLIQSKYILPGHTDLPKSISLPRLEEGWQRSELNPYYEYRIENRSDRNYLIVRGIQPGNSTALPGQFVMNGNLAGPILVSSEKSGAEPFMVYQTQKEANFDTVLQSLKNPGKNISIQPAFLVDNGRVESVKLNDGDGQIKIAHSIGDTEIEAVYHVNLTTMEHSRPTFSILTGNNQFYRDLATGFGILITQKENGKTQMLLFDASSDAQNMNFLYSFSMQAQMKNPKLIFFNAYEFSSKKQILAVSFKYQLAESNAMKYQSKVIDLLSGKELVFDNISIGQPDL